MIESQSMTPAEPGAVAEPRAPQPGYLAARMRRLPPAGVVAVAVLTAALVGSYFPNLRGLVSTWEHDPNYSHGYLVLPIALVILWRRWVDRGALTFRPRAFGLIALALVLVLRAYLHEEGYEWSETATLLPVVACLTLAAGGLPLFRVAWPAIGFLFFLLPLHPKLNGLLSQPLQRVATLGTSASLKISGLWAITEGNVIIIGEDPLEVAVACNGLSMLMCLTATVAAMVALVKVASWKKVALALSIIPIALISNILRISATAWCYHLFGAEKGGHFAHDAAGWLMMPTALALVGVELALLSWLIVAVEEMPAGRPDRAALFRA